MNKNLLLVLIAMLLCSCGTSGEPVREPLPQVVLIFDHIAPQGRFYTAKEGEGPYTVSINPDFSYIDSNGELLYFQPDSSAVDTLVIPTFDGLAEVNYSYRVIETVEYLFMAGDTVRFSDDKQQMPQVAITGKARPKEPLMQRAQNGFSPAGLLTNRLTDRLEKYPQFRDSYTRIYVPKDTLIKLYEKNHSLATSYVDSLYKCDSLYAKRYAYNSALRHKAVSEAVVKLNEQTPQVLDRKMLKYRDIDGEIAALIAKLDDQQVNSLAYRRYILSPLIGKLNELYSTQTTYVHFGGGGGGTAVDNRAAIDSLINDNRISRQSKIVMLRNMVNNMSDLLPATCEIEYQRKYATFAADSAMLKMLSQTEKYLTLSDDIYLVDTLGRETSFTKMIAQQKGNVVYVDYWGAGCPPCIRLIPDALKLQKDYANKNVKFVYITLENDHNAWKKAIRKHKIPGQHYQIINPRGAQMIKELQIFEVPRYMVYDRNGNLVAKRAPKPNDSKIKAILEKYLTR